MSIEEMKKALKELQQKKSAYDHALSLLSFDGDTTAPSGTAANRAHAVAVLSGDSYQFSTSKETIDLLESLALAKDQLSEKEQRQVQLLLKDIRRKKKIPFDEYIAYEELLINARDTWLTAKKNSDFSLLQPYLEKIVETMRRFAALCDPEKDAYDYWLNEYEEGMCVAAIDPFFELIRKELAPVIRAVSQKEQPDMNCLHGIFSDESQKAFSLYLMETLGLDMAHVGLGTTEHPFTTSLGSHLDERITTHFDPHDFSASMFSVIHEGGHALYDTGSDDDLAYTVLDCGVSMGIHESQSRFYENIIGRSKAFAHFITPAIHRFFPETTGYSETDFFRAFNRVEPSLIRTEADEVTYCMHVMIRYELEKKLMNGSLQVKDLPQAWNSMYKEYLGIEVPNDRQGVLQDMHWACGLIGYFPSYALGSAYGAQFYREMKKSMDTDQMIAKGDLSAINAWNREHIWHYGCLKTPLQILQGALSEFDPTVYLDYLKEKCHLVYDS